jgi:2-polyprenyl-6-methoxyphenol hydroxylase-like FAD-dependent oxidoreductase
MVDSSNGVPAPVSPEAPLFAGGAITGVAGSRPERVVIIGAGMAGLATALVLKHSASEVVIVERDAPPDIFSPDLAFDAWKRSGVPQLHHTHIFLARLRTILRDRHPEVLAELISEGIEPSTIDQALPAGQWESAAEPGDDDLLHLWGRRATLEYVLRRHVGKQPNVTFVHSARVEGLVIDASASGLRVSGVEVRRHGEREVVAADVVVDASGARSKAAEWLRARGATIDEQLERSPCAYYCRHFRQRDLATEPPRRGTGANVDYLIFGTFFAEKGTFSIAFAVPDTEPELSEALRHSEGFDYACGRIPALAKWTARAEPISRVLGGAGLSNRWNHYATRGKKAVLGFFPVGDSQVQTNPIYGRGCSSAFVQADVLADVLAASRDPRERMRRFHRGVRTLLMPHFRFSVQADRAFLARARALRGEPLTLLDGVASYLYEHAFGPAIEESPFVAREWIKVQQLSPVSPPWVGFLVVLRTFFLLLVRRVRGIRREAPKFAPPRDEFVKGLPSPQPRSAPRHEISTEQAADPL